MLQAKKEKGTEQEESISERTFSGLALVASIPLFLTFFQAWVIFYQ